MAQKDAKLWTADVVGNWARSTLTELNCPSDTCEEISGRFVTFGFNGAVLASLTIEQWELLVPGVKLTGFRLALFNAWNLVLSQTSHDGLDKGKKRDASRSDDDAADSTTRDASEVRKRARSLNIDDDSNEVVGPVPEMLQRFLDALYEKSQMAEAWYVDEYECPVRTETWMVPASWFGFHGESLFVRECYMRLEAILRGYRDQRFAWLRSGPSGPNRTVGGILVTGTPGVGKSHFLMYLAAKWSCESSTTIVYHGVSGVKQSSALVFDGKSWTLRPMENCMDLLYNPSTIYLCDGLTRSPLGIHYAFTVAAFSPSNLFKDFMKADDRIRVYMPTWTLPELEMCRLTCYGQSVTKDRLESLYNQFGGVVRYTLGKAVLFLESELTAAFKDIITKVNFQSVLTMVGSIESWDNPDIVHRAVHLVVQNDNFTEVIARFASQAIVDSVMDKGNHEQMFRSIDFVRNNTDPLLAGLRGQVFETLVHRYFRRCQTLQLDCRPLVPGLAAQSKIDFIAVGSEVLTVPRDLEQFVDGTYAVSKSRTFPSIDSALLPDTLFQVTVSSTHGIHGATLQKLVTALSARSRSLTKVRLFFVVPSDVFPTFRAQAYLTTKNVQYQLMPRFDLEVEQWVAEMKFT
eukprot:Opistho-2@91748